MASIDPEKEKARLEDAYSRMTDGELQLLMNDSKSLTDLARQALAKETAQRGTTGVEPPPPPPAVAAEIEVRHLVTVRQFRDPTDALLAKGSLDSSGIECFLVDDNMVRLDWFISNLLGGIKLQVNQADVEAANEILDQPIPEDFEVEGVGDYSQPRCSHCNSMDVVFDELSESWKCQSCGRAWKDDGPETGV